MKTNNTPFDIVANLRHAACGAVLPFVPLETKAADEIERLRTQVTSQAALVRALLGLRDQPCEVDVNPAEVLKALAIATHGEHRVDVAAFDEAAKKLAAKPLSAAAFDGIAEKLAGWTVGPGGVYLNPTPTAYEKAPVPSFSASNEPMTIKALAAAMALPVEKTLVDKLNERRSNLIRVLKRDLAEAAEGLAFKNPAIRHQAERDLTDRVNSHMRGYCFDSVQFERVYLHEGGIYAAVLVPAHVDSVEYRLGVSAMTGHQLRVHCSTHTHYDDRA